MQRPRRCRWGPALATAIAVSLSLAPAARAEIASVFSNTPTPVSCEVLTGDDAGIRFCGHTDPNNQPGRTTVKTFDGVPLDVNVAFPPEPATGPDGDFPVVMMFHGYGGQKLGLGSMRRWLNQGYATFSMTTRGFHQSCGDFASREADPNGCEDGYVRLMDTRYEVRDAQHLVGLLVDEGRVDGDRMGAAGGSYGGGLSMALAALEDRQMLPDGTLVPWVSPQEGTPLELAAAAPQIPWTDLAYSLVPNGGLLDYIARAPYFGHVDRVGVPKRAWIETLYIGGLVAPGFYAEPGQDPDADLVGWRDLLLEPGPYDDNPRVLDAFDELSTHHSSYGIDPSVEPAPSMITSGWTDDLFPANEALRYYNRTRALHPGAPIALNLADYGHPRGQNKPTTVAAITATENAWFAHYVKGEGTEPPSRVQALTQTCPSSAPPGGPFFADTYPELAPGEVRFRRNGERTISADEEAPEHGLEFGATRGYPQGATEATACVRTDATDNPKTANYRFGPVPAGGYTLMGSPTVVARFALPGRDSQVAARLLDVAPDGQQTLVARGLWRPKVSGERAVRQVFQLNPNGYRFEEGHVVKLELLPHDFPYGEISDGQRRVSVSRLDLRLPVLEAPEALSGLVGEPARKLWPRGTQLAPGFDSGAPRTRITSGPRGRHHDRDIAFRFEASDLGSDFECRLDGEAWAACQSPQSYDDLALGDHVFRVRAIDPDANVDATPEVRRFRILR